MAERFGPLQAQFFEVDDLDDFSVTPLSYGGRSVVTEIISAEITKRKNMLDSGRMRLALFTNWDKFTAYDQTSHPPRIVALSQPNETTQAGGVGPWREMGAFLTENVEPSHDDKGRVYIDVVGLGVPALLKYWKVWRPVGKETVEETTIATAAAAPAFTTLATGAPAGNDSAHVASDAHMDVGDEVRITMDGGAGVHVTKIAALDVGSEGVIQFPDKLLFNAGAGNQVETRTAVISVVDAGQFQPGMLVEITMDNAAVHSAYVVSKTDTSLTIDTGLTAAAGVGKSVKGYDYSEPATDDVTQIIANAPPWQVVFQTGNGTASGTSHAPKGESVLDVLMATAEQSREFFRYQLAAGTIPEKRLRWRRTHDSSGMTLIASKDQAVINAADSNINRGVIHRFSAGKQRNPVTRLYPFGGDGSISLANVSEVGFLYATVLGFTVHLSDDPYQPDYIEYVQGVNNFGILEAEQTFGHITLGDKPSLAELQQASDALLKEAIGYINQQQERIVYTVECVTHRPLYPGQTVALQNTAIEPLVSESTLYIQEVKEYYYKGVIRSRLVLTKEPYDLLTPGRALGKQLKATASALRRGRGGGAVTIVGAGGGAGSGDHEHLNYLRTDGSLPLTGNLAVNAGVTIDGIDISAHAANPSAHHPLVTSLNQSIETDFAAQQVGVRLAVNGGLELFTAEGAGVRVALPTPSGLERAVGGLALADSVAGAGLTMSGKRLNVTLAIDPGLVVLEDSLRLGSPSSVGVGTFNAISGSNHSHFVISSSNGITNPLQLAQFDSSGKMALAGAGVGIAPDTISALKVQARATDDISLYIKQLSGQTAPMWRVEDTAGDALIILTGDGALESGKPGFVSGLTGWQIAANGNAEFNDVFVRGELHASVFVADEMHAAGGTLAVLTTAKVEAPVGAADNIVPEMNFSGRLILQASYATGLCYFAVNDIIRIKFMSAIVSGGPLDLYDIYFRVTGVTFNNDRNMADGNPGTYVVNVIRRWGGATNVVIPTGTAAVKWGRVGGAANSYTGGMILTSDLNLSPYLDVFTVDSSIPAANTWSGPPTIKPRVRVGNLDGVLGLPQQWGIAMGTDLSSTALDARYIVASDLQFKLNHVDAAFYRNGDRTITINQNGINIYPVNENPSITNYRAIDFRTPSDVVFGYVEGSLTDWAGLGSEERSMTVHASSNFGSIPAIGRLSAANLPAGKTSSLDLVASVAGGATARLNADYIRLTGGLAVGNVVVGDTPLNGRIQASDHIMTDGGLTVGSRTTAPGGTGVVRFIERSTGVDDPPPNCADLFVVSVGGQQQLRIRFENGSTATIAVSS